MPSVLKSRTLSVSIGCPPERAYAFASNPENLPRWATAFVRAVRRAGDRWLIETTDGPSMAIRFVPHNEFGVLDHAVTVAPGVEIMNPMRVVPNGTGSEVLFTLFQQPGMADAKFDEDTGMVERDLQTLKRVLEAQGSCPP